MYKIKCLFLGLVSVCKTNSNLSCLCWLENIAAKNGTGILKNKLYQPLTFAATTLQHFFTNAQLQLRYMKTRLLPFLTNKCSKRNRHYRSLCFCVHISINMMIYILNFSFLRWLYNWRWVINSAYHYSPVMDQNSYKATSNMQKCQF